MSTTSSLNLKINLKDSYVAFIDVMGFSNLVNKNNIADLEAYFLKITEVLDKISIDKGRIKSFLISDSIILIAPDDPKQFKQLLHAIRRIQSALLWKKILLRGAVSFGPIYYNPSKNIIVGKGFIRAYLLEQEANFPRVIIDPSIIKKTGTDKADFITQVNGVSDSSIEDRLIYVRGKFSPMPDDCIFIDYANKTVKSNGLNNNIKKVYEVIVDNLYSDQKLYSKYTWLKDYYLECLILMYQKLPDGTKAEKQHKTSLFNWINKFQRL